MSEFAAQTGAYNALRSVGSKAIAIGTAALLSVGIIGGQEKAGAQNSEREAYCADIATSGINASGETVAPFGNRVRVTTANTGEFDVTSMPDLDAQGCALNGIYTATFERTRGEAAPVTDSETISFNDDIDTSSFTEKRDLKNELKIGDVETVKITAQYGSTVKSYNTKPITIGKAETPSTPPANNSDEADCKATATVGTSANGKKIAPIGYSANTTRKSFKLNVKSLPELDTDCKEDGEYSATLLRKAKGSSKYKTVTKAIKFDDDSNPRAYSRKLSRPIKNGDSYKLSISAGYGNDKPVKYTKTLR